MIKLIACLGLLFSTSVLAYPTFKINNEHLIGIACDTTAQSCLAIQAKPAHDKISHRVLRTEDGGNTWEEKATLQDAPKDAGLGSVDCIEASLFCLSLRGPATIRCDKLSTNCIVADQAYFHQTPHVIIYHTEDRGQTWKKETQRFKGELMDLSCDAFGQQCQLLLNQQKNTPLILTTHNGGETWSSHKLLQNTPLSKMHCADSGENCILVGGERRPMTYISTNFQSIWYESSIHNPNPEASIDTFSHLQCDSMNLNCLAIRYQEIEKPLYIVRAYIYQMENLNGIWKEIGEINSDHEIIEPFNAFSCDASLKTCVAIHRTTAYITLNGGITWSTESSSIIPDELLVFDLACAHDAAMCHIAGFEPNLNGLIASKAQPIPQVDSSDGAVLKKEK